MAKYVIMNVTMYDLDVREDSYSGIVFLFSN